ncbi:Dihydropteroate synthase [Atractiella rhizophila]|nr:Dihydropteroate synthase [Atractiella rhizophila]
MFRTRQELFSESQRSRSLFGGTGRRTFSTSSTAYTETYTERWDRRKEAFIALGTNLGERYENVRNALKRLEADDRVKVEETSGLYESEPMYVTDQPRFLNAVIKISTTLSQPALLSYLKQIERSFGRPSPFSSRPTTPDSESSYKPNGPRILDLDILLYGDESFQLRTDEVDEGGNEMWLKIPHERMTEREFVLRPLADIIPDRQIGVLGDRTPSDLLSALIKSSASTSSSLTRYLPLDTSSPSYPSNLTFALPPRRTLLMSIINLTPDSFSDGSPSEYKDLDRNHRICLEHISNGADILDLGGYSTRPGAEEVSEEEELNRVLPLIHKLRREGVRTPISIDTFRASVARACVEAGANIVNDVTGGRGDEKMLETVKKLDCPIVLMHMRGNSSTMASLADYDEQGGIVKGVKKELAERVRDALDAGIKRWNIIIDPGLGFAKGGATTSIHLIRNLSSTLGSDKDAQLLANLPVLFGPSRKSFLGQVVGRPKGPPAERDWATAAAVTAAVGSGAAEIVRVHETKGMKDVLAVADEIYRKG